VIRDILYVSRVLIIIVQPRFFFIYVMLCSSKLGIVIYNV
jgi:hypothetical protein